ncbi:uncharacterized protein SCHCODRAFT_02672667 [Schizophyllum commune H4-8]|nr:uncharacterized protein SCHCODRAFT_02672667 [Schizophyllum commune H4-8]KAI5886457.1 hypothetical protein SCHCODRAFT_02672667 [Schizophyllum commune H4-8]
MPPATPAHLAGSLLALYAALNAARACHIAITARTAQALSRGPREPLKMPRVYLFPPSTPYLYRCLCIFPLGHVQIAQSGACGASGQEGVMLVPAARALLSADAYSRERDTLRPFQSSVICLAPTFDGERIRQFSHNLDDEDDVHNATPTTPVIRSLTSPPRLFPLVHRPRRARQRAPSTSSSPHSPGDVLCLLLPALLSSIVAGGVAPFMTYVIGQFFNMFAQFPLTPNPPQSAKDALLQAVGISALELLGLAIGSIALGSLTSCFWIWTSERNVLGFRRRVYTAVAHKPIAWFDTAVAPGEGAGGMMATFAREMDDVHAASSLSSGLLIQHPTTLVTCLRLAFSLGGPHPRYPVLLACPRLRASDFAADPAVLILDKPTFALDIALRILVFEAIKRWRLPPSERDMLYSPSTVASSMHTAPRKTRTTMVVTHDLSHIDQDDFVYVMRNGRVAEQGFRKDLEARNISTEARDSRSVVDDEFDGDGEFLRLRDAQAVRSPDGSEPGAIDEGWECAKEKLEDSDEAEEAAPAAWRAPNVFSGAFARPDSLAAPNLSKRLTRLKTMSNSWMLDAIADITAAPERAEAPRQEKEKEKRKTHTSRHATYTAAQAARRRPSMHVSIPVSPPPAYDQVEYGYRRRRGLQFTPSSPTFVKLTHRTSGEIILDEDEKRGMEAASSALRPTARPDRRNRNAGSVDIRVEGTKKASDEPPAPRPPGLFATLRAVYPDAPYKPLFLLGLFLCLANGAMTPVFSFFLSRLMFEVSTGSTNVGLINRVGGLVLGVTCLDGLLMGTKYFIMETLAGLWADRMRAIAFANVLAQDKAWFDRPANTVSRIVQVLVKDAEDAKLLLSTVIGQMVVVTAMFGSGLLWALARGWELNLAGFAVAPVFMGVMAIQTQLVGECERRNRLAREQVSKGYYETISNIRAIRSMTYDDIFHQQFEKAAAQALKSGVRGAFTEGCTGGIASGLIYFAEPLLFYIGAVLIANGRYSYLRMVETLNLVVFMVTIGSQIMAFTAKISKATQATTQLNELGHLSPLDTTEAKGTECPALYGDINFRNVDLAYPERPDAPVLRDFTLRIKDGECVAIVGESGSGKSTVASLLQRLYEPQAGMISIGYHNIRHVDVDHLRHYLAIVSQHPQLWDASVRDNITYGTPHMPEFHILRATAAARAQEFIMELPQGYDTMLGEDAARLSGGQKQRLQIARALARLGVHVGRGVLVLDECTSALDAESQRGVLEAITRAKEGRTTVMITHKLEAMQMGDRIVLLKDGQVCEEGTFEELMARAASSRSRRVGSASPQPMSGSIWSIF